MKRIFATLISCFVLLSATVSVPALAEAKDEIQQSDVSALQDILTKVADGIQCVLDGVKTNIVKVCHKQADALDDSESADAPVSASEQDTDSTAVIPSDIAGVVWGAGYTTCTLTEGANVAGDALIQEISSHKTTLTTFIAEDNTSLSGSVGGLFQNCSLLNAVNLSPSFSTSAVTDMNLMFSSCSQLTSLTLPDGFDTGSVNNMSSMFAGCSRLETLTLPGTFDTSSVTNMTSMFNGCSKLNSLSLPDAFDTSAAVRMAYMFQNCSSLTSLSLPDTFLPTAAQYMSNLFYGCSSLTSLTLPDNFAAPNASTGNMFAFASPGDTSLAMKSLTLPKSFTMKTGTGLPGLATQGDYKNYWTTSVDSCVNYDTTELQAVANINSALAASTGSVTFTNVNVALTFNANGGTYVTTNDAPESLSNADEAKYLFGNTDAPIASADMPAPKLVGLSFLGWSVVRDGAVVETLTSFPDTDTTYFAKWGTLVTITFDANEHGAFEDTQVTLKIDCIPGEKLTLPDEDALSVADGYVFNGWFTEALGGTQVTDETDCPATATTYYAQYTEAPAPTPEPTPDVVPVSDADALPVTGDTFAALASAVVAVLMSTLALLASGYSLIRKRLQ